MAHSLEIGGAEKSLLGLLESLNTKKYYVDLFLLRHDGELMSYIPKGVNLLPSNKKYASLGVPITSVLKQGNIGVAIGRLNGKYRAKKRIAALSLPTDNNVYNEYSHKYTVPMLPLINNKKYDLAISFMSPHYFVAQKVNANIKIAWIHTDYSTFSVDKESELQMWNKYDYIASISKQVTVSFLNIFPELSKKIVLIPNIIPVKLMKEQANAFSVDDEMPCDENFRILSIGRFCNAKNFDNVPEICRLIRDMGIGIKWYLIGYGGDEVLIQRKIAENGMQDHVIVLGKKENPYPYIAACDLYVQPSRYEGKCVSVIEAQILNKPVVITNYATSSSQLQDGYDGVIVPLDKQKCAEGIRNVLKDTNLQETLINNTMKKDYANSYAVERIYEILRGENEN